MAVAGEPFLTEIFNHRAGFKGGGHADCWVPKKAVTEALAGGDGSGGDGEAILEGSGWVATKIRKLRAEGKSQEQAVAVALSMAREKGIEECGGEGGKPGPCPEPGGGGAKGGGTAAPASRADYEAGGFVFRPVDDKWRDRVDEDDKVLVFHPRWKGGKEPYHSSSSEERALAFMAKAEKTQTLMKEPAAKPATGPARDDVTHGDEVKRSVLVGDRMMTLKGKVERAKGGQLYVRTEPVDLPVWAGGGIPSKRIKITDDWLKADHYDAQQRRGQESVSECGGEGGKPGPCAGPGSADAAKGDSASPAPDLHAKAETKAQGVVGKVKAALGKLTDKPGLRHAKAALGWLKAKQQQFQKGLENRYGKTVGRAVMASGIAADLAVTGVGAALGKVVYVPGLSILGALPAAALAEGYLQASKLWRKKAAESFLAEGEFSPEEIAGIAKEEFGKFHGEYVEYLKGHGLAEVSEAEGVAETEGEDLGDADERADLIAEILAGVYGDQAPDLFDEVKDPGEEVTESLLFEWDDIDHPRGKGGRFIPKGSAEAVATAKEKVKAALKEPPTPEGLRQLTEHLSILTVKQLHELKKEHGLKASGRTKDALREKIARRLDKGRREPAEAPKATPKAKRKPKPPTDHGTGAALDDKGLPDFAGNRGHEGRLAVVGWWQKELEQQTGQPLESLSKSALNAAYSKAMRKKGALMSQGYAASDIYRQGDAVSNAHYLAVKHALADGKSVPPAVLADYPDLKPKATPAAPAPKDEPKAAGSAPASHPAAVADAVQKLGADSGGLADMVQVRKHLADAGLTGRAEQDAAIHAARQQGLVTAAPYEGRHGISKEQQAAVHRSPDGEEIGYLQVRRHGNDVLPTQPPKPTSAKVGPAGLPSDSDLAGAKVEPLKVAGAVHGAGGLSKVSVGGEAYFHKQAPASEAANEVATAALAGIAGVNVPAARKAAVGGKEGVLSAWSTGTAGDKDKAAFHAAVKADPEGATRHAAFNFLVGAEDRHAGNYVVGPDGKIASIDHSDSLSPRRSPAEAAELMGQDDLLAAMDKAQGGGDIRFHPGAVKDVAAKVGAMADHLRRDGMDAQAKALEARGKVLQALAREGQPTEGRLRALAGGG